MLLKKHLESCCLWASVKVISEVLGLLLSPLGNGHDLLSCCEVPCLTLTMVCFVIWLK